MDDFGPLGEIIVTLRTESRTGLQQEFRLITGMRGMTGGTAFVGNDRVNATHPFRRIIVTADAEITAGGDEEFAILAEMWVVTTGTAVFQGRMDDLLPLAHAVMTLLAERSTTGRELEAPLLSGMGKPGPFVAGGAITISHRAVKLYSLDAFHRCMTFGRHAPLGSIEGERRNEKPRDSQQDRSLRLHSRALS